MIWLANYIYSLYERNYSPMPLFQLQVSTWMSNSIQFKSFIDTQKKSLQTYES